MWFVEQVEHCALGRGCWLGARSTSTSTGCADQVDIKRKALGVISPSSCDGDSEPLNLPLTSVLPFSDGWHLRDWNWTVWVWHAFSYFQRVNGATLTLRQSVDNIPISLQLTEETLKMSPLCWMESSHTVYLFIYLLLNYPLGKWINS